MVAFVPYFGALENVRYLIYTDEIAEGLKHTDEVSEGLKYTDNVIEGAAKTVPAGLVREGQTAVIGKMADLNAPAALSNGEFRVADYLPDMGSPEANWKQNEGVLRSIMNEGKPIRDVSAYPMDNAGFLGAERNLLQNNGWIYSNGYWNPSK